MARRQKARVPVLGPLPGLPPEPLDDKWKPGEFLETWRELIRKLGSGATYPEHVRRLILARVVPEWVFRGCLMGETDELKKRCALAATALEKLHGEIFPHERIRDE